MHVHDIELIYQQLGDNEKRVWKLLAYAGRYGHQPISTMMRLTLRELGQFVAQLNEIVEEENTPQRGTARSLED